VLKYVLVAAWREYYNSICRVSSILQSAPAGFTIATGDARAALHLHLRRLRYLMGAERINTGHHHAAQRVDPLPEALMYHMAANQPLVHSPF
jgi:hypothetical protein